MLKPKIDIAMVFAAGFGTRMRPLTLTTPKPLVKIGGKPMIDYVLAKLAEAAVTTAVVNTHHLADKMAQHLAGVSQPKILISYEENILETGGGIVRALPMLGDQPFYVVNTDTLWLDKGQPALIRLADSWNPEKMDALLLLANLNDAVGYDGKGDFNLLPNGILQRSANCEFVYSGVMIIKPELFKLAETKFYDRPFSIFKDFLFREEKYNGKNNIMPRIHGLVHSGSWLHVGTIDAITKAEHAMQEFLINNPAAR